MSLPGLDHRLTLRLLISACISLHRVEDFSVKGNGRVRNRYCSPGGGDGCSGLMFSSTFRGSRLAEQPVKGPASSVMQSRASKVGNQILGCRNQHPEEGPLEYPGDLGPGYPREACALA